MSSYFWVCRANCTWKKSKDFDKAIKANGVRGTIKDFDSLNTAFALGNNDVFCVEALGKMEMGADLFDARNTFRIGPSPASGANNLCIWGHHSGNWDLVYMVVVTELSAIHLKTQARPESWKQKHDPVPLVTYGVISQALAGW
jgi:hypothetical protein